MDYLHFKKKIVLTRSYNFLFLETTTSISNSINIGIINIDSIPLVIAIGSESQLSSLLTLLNTSKFNATIHEQVDINNQIIIKNSDNLESNIISNFLFDSIINIDGAQLVRINNIQGLFNILTNVYTPPPIRPMNIDIDLTLPLEVNGGIGFSAYTKAHIIDISSMCAITELTTPIDLETSVTHQVSLTIVIANDNPIVVAGSSTASINIISLIESSAPNITMAQADICARINGRLGMCRKALLADYNDSTLGSWYDKKINDLLYIDII